MLGDISMGLEVKANGSWGWDPLTLNIAELQTKACIILISLQCVFSMNKNNGP